MKNPYASIIFKDPPKKHDVVWGNNFFYFGGLGMLKCNYMKKEIL